MQTSFEIDYVDPVVETIETLCELGFESKGHCYVSERGDCRAAIRPSNGWLYLMNIRTNPRSRSLGQASALLRDICRIADDFRVTVFLEVEAGSDSDMTESQLLDWYWRHGFRGCKSEMIREPQ
ncbi:hypothetical protein [Neorhodopirellula pilleata]|uniref:N-acetyltransferase domain-containing protein n=1 Tax=Neorhodopirellula pilleata TaxID=2714738 RepID=A0A5C6A9P7_9BACT|nr:hypothetical protein [Neorhodopirellula pilleata]TWT95771.1 hypothetical protein Pla100_34130 [Neorhodopirellula pilleata]